MVDSVGVGFLHFVSLLWRECLHAGPFYLDCYALRLTVIGTDEGSSTFSFLRVETYYCRMICQSSISIKISRGVLDNANLARYN